MYFFLYCIKSLNELNHQPILKKALVNNQQYIEFFLKIIINNEP